MVATLFRYSYFVSFSRGVGRGAYYSRPTVPDYIVFLVHVGEVIPGWDVGVATMRKSELSRFLVNPSYAFGDIGCPPRIPPGATSELMHIYVASGMLNIMSYLFTSGHRKNAY